MNVRLKIRQLAWLRAVNVDGRLADLRKVREELCHNLTTLRGFTIRDLEHMADLAKAWKLEATELEYRKADLVKRVWVVPMPRGLIVGLPHELAFAESYEWKKTESYIRGKISDRKFDPPPDPLNLRISFDLNDYRVYDTEY